MSSKEIKVGFIRDKTTQFRNFRSSYSHDLPSSNNIETGLMGSSAFDVTPQQADSAMIQQANYIETQFNVINNEINALSELHKSRLRGNFSDNKTQDAAIEAKTRSISGQITSLRDQLRSETPSVNNQQKVIEENMKKGFLARLRDLTIRFRDLQGNYITAIKKQNEKAANLIGDQDDADDFGLDDFDPGLTGEQTAQIVANDLMLQQRNQEIEQMISMMNQLNDLFSDLGTLIIQQGTVLDRIDNTIVEAIEDVEQGNEYLVKANTDQKSKCFYIYILVTIVLILILGTIIIIRKYTSDDSGGSSGESGKSVTRAVLGI